MLACCIQYTKTCKNTFIGDVMAKTKLLVISTLTLAVAAVAYSQLSSPDNKAQITDNTLNSVKTVKPAKEFAMIKVPAKQLKEPTLTQANEKEANSVAQQPPAPPQAQVKPSKYMPKKEHPPRDHHSHSTHARAHGHEKVNNDPRYNAPRPPGEPKKNLPTTTHDH